ncbi:hypothetical protein Tco_0214931 [Tanacetum coccineum]
MVEYLEKVPSFERSIYVTNVTPLSAVKAAENILPVAAHEEAETIHNMTTENKLYFQAEKEAIFLILTGIGDEIYSTVDSCNTAKEMWTAIERLQQVLLLNGFRNLMNDVDKEQSGKFSPMPMVNVQFLQQLQPEWSRFVTVVKQRQEIDTVSYHKLFDVLKQFQNEVNDIRSERLARSGKSH